MKGIVFFDGVCNLCNGFVNFVLSRDHRRRLKVASLQGQSAKQYLVPELHRDLTSVVYRSGNGDVSTKSTAVLAILQELGGGWSLLARGLRIFPRFIRDAVYNVVAKYRYSVFGKRNTCRVPTPEERSRFLD